VASSIPQRCRASIACDLLGLESFRSGSTHLHI
jgi:hypothetical protein